jgi:Bacterial type II/III secretion system short domain
MINPIWLLVLMSRFWPQVGALALPPGPPADEIRGLLLELFEPPRVIAILPAPPDARVLIVAGNREGLELVRQVLSRPPCCPGDGPQVPVHPVYLKYADARALVRVLEPGLPSLAGLGPVRIVADVPTNSLVVEATEADFALLSPLIAALDKPPFPSSKFALPQVLVASLAEACGEEADTLAAYCHVVEGWRCFPVPAARIDSYDGRYDPDLAARSLPVGLTTLIIMVVDPRHVEHARGNGVKLRCRRGDGGRWKECGVDRGWGEGWEPVAISGD